MLWQLSIFGENSGVDPTAVGINEITLMLVNVVNIALYVIGIVVFIYIIIGGIQYVTAAGNASKQTEAKRAITAAIIGMIIVAFSFAITRELLQRLDFDASIGGNEHLEPIQDGIQ